MINSVPHRQLNNEFLLYNEIYCSLKSNAICQYTLLYTLKLITEPVKLLKFLLRVPVFPRITKAQRKSGEYCHDIY